MTFQSITFIIFFTIVLLLNWTLCRKNRVLQNGLVVLSSLVFYGWWDWRFLGLVLLTALSTYFAVLGIVKAGTQKKRKVIFVSTLLLNLGILFFLKYFNFFVDAITSTLALMGVKAETHTLNIILPIGISFYTFSALSYVIDVYQKKVDATKDVLAYLAYMTFFPSILSGPINRAQKQLPQFFKLRTFDYDKAVEAVKVILMGGVMKLCLADRLGIYVDSVYGSFAQHNGTTLLLTSILYSIQIYADFAGYSLMAIGFGKLLGIDLQNNFNRPYFSKTVTEFWRRWHISLTTWFRDYIYFPLGGSRCSKVRWALNTIMVFVVSGLWHGAAYNFILWGAIHGFVMVIEKQIYGDKLKAISNKVTLANLCRMLLTFVIVNFAWIFFRIPDFGDAITIIKTIFTDFGMPFIDIMTLLMALFSFIIVVFYDILVECNCHFNSNSLKPSYRFVNCFIVVFLICLIISFGVLNGGSFIYFKF